MKITFIGSNFPDAHNAFNGTYNFETAAALSSLGHEYNIVVPRPWLQAMKTPEIMQRPLDAERINGEIYYAPFYYTPGMLHRTHSLAEWLSLKALLKRTQTTFDPDVIVSYFALPDGNVAGRLANSMGKPFVYISGGSDVLLIDSEWRHQQTLAVLDQATRITTVSDGLRAKIIEFGVDSAKISTIRQGINAEHYFPGNKTTARRQLDLPSDRPILVWVGRMAPVKDLPLLINACALLKSTPGCENFLLILIGDGPVRAELESMVKQHGMHDNVLFAGGMPNKDLPPWYRASDLSVLSSSSEGIPNSLRESLACGTGFVATDVGSIAEIVVPDQCDLVPHGDAEALSAAIAKRILAGATIFEPVTRTWTDTARDYEVMFQDAIRDLKSG